MAEPTRRATPLDEATVWRGPDLAGDRSWIRTFSPAEVAELDAALAALGGAPPFGFGKADFPLPALGPALEAIGEDLERGRGFVLLRGLPVERWSAADIERVYAGIGCHLGKVITQNTKGDRLGRITDAGTDYTRAGTRGHTSNSEIRPHCDSADVVALLCVSPAHRGGESRIASATTVFNEILAHHPHYLEPLYRGFHINLAGKGPTGRLEECSNHPIPVFSYHAGRMSCRYNRKQIEDAACILGKPLSALEDAAVACVGDTAMSDAVRLDMDFRAGDVQLLNNHCILHARAGYEDHPSQRRLLLRMWINTPVSRPLAPEFADRLNTGPRGEIPVLA